MTTKSLDNKIYTFKILLSWRFPRKKKQRFWTIFLSAPEAHALQKRKFYFYCRLAVSEFLQLLIRKNVGHACIFVVHDGILGPFLALKNVSRVMGSHENNFRFGRPGMFCSLLSTRAP